MYAYIGWVLHIYNKLLVDVFIQYGNRYKKSKILLINEGQYVKEDNKEDHFLKLPSNWTFNSSYERDRNTKTKLCSFVNVLVSHPNMRCRLRTFKFRIQ